MKETSIPDIGTLIKLQEAETEIVRLKLVLEQVEKNKVKAAVRLKEFEKAVNQHNEDFEKAKSACQDSEREIQVVSDRIVRSNEHLRMVKTNKEYQVLLREVDDNKKRKDALENEMLDFLEEKEKLEALVLESEKEYALLEQQILSEQAELEKQSADDKELLEEYLARQAHIGKTLDPALMNKFRRISKMNKGSAMARVHNEVCLGCFMNVPPQLYIEVQRGVSLISCPICSRILYYSNTD